MSPQQSELPDLKQGIALSALAEGSIVKGKFDGAELILVRSAGQFFALEAACTHMGGPLADGAVIGDCVHCPWHHARFSLATGEAVSAPAFAALKRYQTRVEADKVLVVAALARPSKPPRREIPRIVIVGAGGAGYACAEWLARRGAGERVTLVGSDADGPYQRTMCSKEYLDGSAPRAQILLPLPADLTRITASIEHVDPRRKCVVTTTGTELPYDVLILATGATPRRLDVPGFDRPNVFTLRSLKDADAILAAAEGARHAAVIGAGFIGLEAAASLRQRHLEVSVIAPGSIPLEHVVGAEVGTMIRQVHESQGVRFHLGHQVRGFDGKHVHLDHGGSVDADLVVLGLGVTPDTRLAEAAGIACASSTHGGGILVDEFLATSVPGIYAAGDIASYPDERTGRRIRVEHWVNAQRQGQYLARALLGERSRYSDLPFFWSAHFDTGLLYMGHVSRIARAELDGSIGDRSFTLRLSGVEQEAAFVTCNRDVPALLIEANWEHRLLAREYMR